MDLINTDLRDLAKKLHELIHEPITTPYNLLENVTLNNYSYVNYYKGENELISEMKCTMQDGKDAIFYYHFDLHNNLQKIYMQDETGKNLVFERQNEIQKIKELANIIEKSSERRKELYEFLLRSQKGR